MKLKPQVPEGFRLLKKGERIRKHDFFILGDQRLEITKPANANFNPDLHFPIMRKVDETRSETN